MTGAVPLLALLALLAGPACQAGGRGASLAPGIEAAGVGSPRVVAVESVDCAGLRKLLKPLRRQAAAREDVVACERLDAQLWYLDVVARHQALRVGLARRLKWLDADIESAIRSGSEIGLANLRQQRQALEAEWQAAALAPLSSFGDQEPRTYGLFLLDLRALDPTSLERVVQRLEREAKNHRWRVEQAGEAQARGATKNAARVAGPLARIQAQARFDEEMARSLDDLLEFLRAGRIEEAQQHADARWTEVYGS